nr:hypothetical protein CFP56_31625 [Quercus suber]
MDCTGLAIPDPPRLHPRPVTSAYSVAVEFLLHINELIVAGHSNQRLQRRQARCDQSLCQCKLHSYMLMLR